MRSNDFLESMLRKLRYETTADGRRTTLENIFLAMAESHEQPPAAGRPWIWRMTMNTRTPRLALAAAVILIVLGGLSFWPAGHAGKEPWWRGSPAAWGREITASLNQVKALIYREGYVFVGNYGSTHTSGNWSRWYKAADRRRRDTYYNDTLVNTMWEVPEGERSVLRYDVVHEERCYTVATYESGPHGSDPVDMLRFYVKLLEKADRVLDPETFEGKECVGFEVSASKYGSNPEEWIDRIWFDKESGLPVRIEHHGRPITDHPEETMTQVQDQFRYYVQMPADEFEPRIPEGYVNAHPDTIRKARERQEKGEMVFADVPAGLKDDLFAAFRKSRTVAYTEGDRRFYVSRTAWRVDRLEGDRVLTTEWRVVQKADEAPTSLDFNDKGFRVVQTTVDYSARTYRQIEHRESGWLGHPLDYLAFIIGLVGQADRLYESGQIDGVECFGFDVSAKKYGTNPDGAFHRVWLDAATNLPVRLETHWPTGAGVNITIKEQFDWDPALPEDFFTPVIPPDFTPVEE